MSAKHGTGSLTRTSVRIASGLISCQGISVVLVLDLQPVDNSTGVSVEVRIPAPLIRSELELHLSSDVELEVDWPTHRNK